MTPSDVQDLWVGSFSSCELEDYLRYKVINSRIRMGIEERIKLMSVVKRRDMEEAGSPVHMAFEIDDDTTYRVRITRSGVEVICLGVEKVDAECEGHYDSVDCLPDWMQERLAVLMIMSGKPPTGELKNVGRRISEHVFWVYAPVHAAIDF